MLFLVASCAAAFPFRLIGLCGYASWTGHSVSAFAGHPKLPDWELFVSSLLARRVLWLPNLSPWSLYTTVIIATHGLGALHFLRRFGNRLVAQEDCLWRRLGLPA
jgi:hypothetical protein